MVAGKGKQKDKNTKGGEIRGGRRPKDADSFSNPSGRRPQQSNRLRRLAVLFKIPHGGNAITCH